MSTNTPPHNPNAQAEAERVKSVSDAPQQQAGASVIGAVIRAAHSSSMGQPQGFRHYRWVICALLFFATTVNYLDRVVLGLVGSEVKDRFVLNMNAAGRIPYSKLKASAAEIDAARPQIIQFCTVPTKERKSAFEQLPAPTRNILDAYQRESEVYFARLNQAFQLAYAFGLLFAGRAIDFLGTKLGLAIALCCWSVAGMSHAFARGVWSFAAARFALGVAESGNFPACIKTVAEWFPKKERALATGIFNSGTNVGAVIAPIIVPFVALSFGWQKAFLIPGTFGITLLIIWLLFYRRPQEHRSVTSAELAYINSDPPDASTAKIPWGRLFPYRQTWAFALGKMLTDPIWWFFLFWLPTLLREKFQLSLTEVSIPLVVIYVAADIGSIGGGWISSALLGRGATVNRARKTAMLICALCVVPVYFAIKTDHKWVAIGLIALAMSAHQGWSANLFTLVSDTFPRRAVGSVVGIGGFMGGIGGFFFSMYVGDILSRSKNYSPMFIAASCTYLMTLVIIHMLVPRLEPAPVDGTATL